MAGFVSFSIWWPYHQEQPTVNLIVRLGGEVETESAAPKWLRDALGEDRITKLKIFERVHSVSLRGTSVTDVNVLQLSGLFNLDELNLGDTQVTDAGLPDFTRMKNLTKLSFFHTKISDAGLARLRGMKKLSFLQPSSEHRRRMPAWHI